MMVMMVMEGVGGRRATFGLKPPFLGGERDRAIIFLKSQRAAKIIRRKGLATISVKSHCAEKVGGDDDQ